MSEYRDFIKRFAAGDTASFTEKELDAARTLGSHIGVGIEKADATTTGGDGDSLIIAWYPFDGDADDDDDFAKTVSALSPGGYMPSDLHITLVYMGDAENYDVDLVAAAVKLIAATRSWKVEGCVSGLGRFVGDGNEDIIVALIDSPGLADFRQCVISNLRDFGVFVNGDGFGHGWVPHITLNKVTRQTASPAPLTETIPFCIDSLSIRAGDGVKADFDFTTWEDSPSAMPYYASRAVVAKAGRVLSSKNLPLVGNAIDALTALAEAAKCEADPSEEAEKRALLAADLSKGWGGPSFGVIGSDPDKQLLGRYDIDFGTSVRARENAAWEAQKRALGIGDDDADLEYSVTKSVDESRYTFGPLYAPDRLDAHKEWTDTDNLQTAQWGYVRSCIEKGSNRINLQHDDSGESTVGEWVDICSWPYETTIKVAVPGEDPRELVMPANTVYMGVIWDDDAWENGVKKGKIGGLSLGGKTMRVNEAEAPDSSMGDQIEPRVAAKMKEHDYVPQDDGGGVCKVCHMSKGDGNHTGS